jgi:hypothetical protein
LVFVVLGLGFAVGATAYQVGTPARMGPGWFPLVLGGLLTVLGLAVIAKAFLAPEGEPIGTVPWRAIVLIAAGILFFGLTVRGLGLAPAVFGAVFLSSFASDRTRIVHALAIAAGLTVLCVLIFVVALQLRLPLLGTWVGG